MHAGQDWCSLCYAAVGPAFDPLTAPLDIVIGVADGDGGSVDPGAMPPEVAPMSEPEQLADSPRPPEVDERKGPNAEISDFDVMVSMLAAEHRRSELASGLAERLGDRSTRIAVIVGGTVLVGSVLFAMLTVLDALI